MIVSSATHAQAQPSTAAAASPSTQPVMGEQFMQLLLAQLRNQNPLEPMENSEFMGQMTQLNSLQELKKMNDSLAYLVNLVEAQSAADVTPKDAA